jgi:5-methylcytosine-specific restriction endonuclease McrA
VPDASRYQRDPELNRRRRMESYHRHREREIDYKRRYYAANKQRIRETERARYWRDRQQQLFNSATRRALRSQAECELTQEQWEWVLARCGHRCAYCGTAATLTEPLQLDHAVALSLGGRHALGNVLPACPSCNRRKHNKRLDDWLDELVDSGQWTVDSRERLLRELSAHAADWEIEQSQAGIEQGPALTMEAA